MCQGTLLRYLLLAGFALTAAACSQEPSSLENVPRTRIDTTTDFLGPGTESLASPFLIDLLPDGRIAVLDPARYRVNIYHPDGSLDFHVGREGKGPGEFVTPRGLDVTDSYINVNDVSTLMIHQFNHEGTFIRNYITERESFFGFVAPGKRRSYFVVANGSRQALIRYHDTETDSFRYFGEPVAGDPPPPSDTESFRSAAADDEVPEAIANDLLMEHHGDHLYAALKNIPLLRRYTGGKRDWETEIDLPASRARKRAFAEAFEGPNPPPYREVRYLSDMAAADSGVYLLWNGSGDYPQQVIRLSSSGQIRHIYELPRGENRALYGSLAVDEERGRVYLLDPSAAEVTYFAM